MNKILVAYDGTEPAHRALDLAADLANHFEARVGVVSVVPFHPGRVSVDPWDDREVHAGELVEARAALIRYGIEPVLYEPAGDPAKTIEQVAADGDYDVIVIGSRGLNAVSRALQGSVSEHVSTHAAATVVVVR